MAKHASPRTGTLSRVVDRRTGYVTFRGRVMFDYTEYRVAVGVRAGMTERQARTACRAKLDALIARLAERRLVRDELERWLEAKKGTLRSPSSHRTYARHVRTHVLPHAIARKRLDAVSAQTMRDFVADLRAAGTGPAMINYALDLLFACFQDVLADQVPLDNLRGVLDARARFVQAHVPAETLAPSPAQLDRLVDACLATPFWGALVLVLIDTGCRIGEGLGFRWGDFSAVAGTLDLRRQSDHDTREAREIKNPKKVRTIALWPETVAALREEHGRRLAAGDWAAPAAPIFRDPNPVRGVAPGEAMFHKKAWRHYKTLLAAAGLPAFSLHALRHGAAQAMRGAKVDTRTIGDRLGHADQKTTNIYFHTDEEADAAAASAYRARVRGPGRAVRTGVRTVEPPEAAQEAGSGLVHRAGEA
jgi:integrase